MFTRNIRIKDLGKYERKCASDLKKGYGEFLRAVAAPLVISELKAQTANYKPFPPVYTRRFINGWKIQSNRQKAGVVSIWNIAPHAQYVEDGRRRGAKAPPINILEQWVKRKLSVSSEDAKFVAVQIAKKIKARGIKAKRIVKKSMPRIRAVHRAPLTAWVFDFYKDWRRYRQ